LEEGLFITLEGTEGTGKSTQAALLGEALEEEGRQVLVTRQPGGTGLGGELRRILLGFRHSALDPLAELFLYMADRTQHMAEIVLPALSDGEIVICDRFADATLAYQGYGRGLSSELITGRNSEATFGRMPDLTILLDFDDVKKGLSRAVDRNEKEGTDGVEDRFEREAVDFHLAVQRGYRALAAADPGRWRVLPADLSVVELQVRIFGAVRDLLGER